MIEALGGPDLVKLLQTNRRKLHMNKLTIKKESQLCENQLVSYKEAARYLSLSESYLRRLKNQGKIPYVSIGLRSVRFRISSLNQWVERREIK